MKKLNIQTPETKHKIVAHFFREHPVGIRI